MRPPATRPASAAIPAKHAPVRPPEHPLTPLWRWAEAAEKRIERVNDYSCTFIKRERVGRELLEPQTMFAKVRHRPFSVYLYFQGPKNLKGQEAIYVEGRNNGDLKGHGVGLRAVLGTMSLKPTGMLAMQGNRYPITEMGLLNLHRHLLRLVRNDLQYGESEVTFYKDAQVNGRLCNCVQVVHPVRRREFRYHVVRVYIDQKLNLAIRFEGHDWPSQAGGAPQLLEEYTCANIRFNNGFTDRDFDTANPNYGFR